MGDGQGGSLCRRLRGGSQVDFFLKNVSEFINDKSPLMIFQHFKAVLKVLGHLHCNFGLDRLLGPKICFFFNIIPNRKIECSNERSCFSDRNGTKFFKIEQKLTEIRHFKNLYFKGL